MSGGGVEGAGFWLPAEFLTDDDFLMDKEIFKKSNYTESDSEFCFPSEFPYDFETQTHQLLEKFWMMSTSPQSTLTHLGSVGGSSNGSPNGVPSPPTTPLVAKYDAVGDLINLAAGQVAKLKLNSKYGPEEKTPFASAYLNKHFQHKQQSEGCRMLYGQQTYQNRGGMGAGAWAPRQNPTRGRPVLFDGSGGGGGAPPRKPCAGTGVFLPRRYENMSHGNAFSSDSQRRPGTVTVGFHTKGLAQSPPQPQAQINCSFGPDYYSLMARRHTLAVQQRRRLLAVGSSVVGHDHMYLPQDWSY